MRHYELKLRPFANFELLFSFLDFILTLLLDLIRLGSRDQLVQVAYLLQTTLILNVLFYFAFKEP